MVDTFHRGEFASGQRRNIRVRHAALQDVAAIAQIHGEGFARGWSEAEIESLMVRQTNFALMCEYRRWFGRWRPVGFVLVQVTGLEAEILSVCVLKGFRRGGLGRRLMEDVLRILYRDRVGELHLEVDSENLAAVNLYSSLDFQRSGERPAYYRQGLDRPREALVMTRLIR